MIIKPKKLPYPGFNIAAWALIRILKWRFNKLVIHRDEIKPGCSYLLLCNHLSFWDGFWAAYLVSETLNSQAPLRGFYPMILKKQLQKNGWLRYFGCFSVSPFGNTTRESIAFAADKLNTPGQVVVLFPQGNLESQHVRHIELKTNGIAEILKKTEGDVQILWSSNLTEYFESLKPSVHFHLLNCGTRADLDIDSLAGRINAHHQAAIRSHFRFTAEPQM